MTGAGVAVAVCCFLSARASAAETETVPAADASNLAVVSVGISVGSQAVMRVDGDSCYYFSSGKVPVRVPARTSDIEEQTVSALMLGEMGRSVGGGVWISPKRGRGSQGLTVTVSAVSRGWSSEFRGVSSRRGGDGLRDSWRLYGIFQNCNLSKNPYWSDTLPGTGSRGEPVIVSLLDEWVRWATDDAQVSASLVAADNMCHRGDCGRLLELVRLAGTSWLTSDAPVFGFLRPSIADPGPPT